MNGHAWVVIEWIECIKSTYIIGAKNEAGEIVLGFASAYKLEIVNNSF